MEWLEALANELGGNLSAALRQAITDARLLEIARADYRDAPHQLRHGFANRFLRESGGIWLRCKPSWVIQDQTRRSSTSTKSSWWTPPTH